jgi:4-alpha-glucanotransferase
MPRRAGVLVPLFSLRTSRDWGIGEIPDLVPFSAWAARAGFQVVQILPVNEASLGQNSPYAALSAFAIDPAYLSLEDVPERQPMSPEDRETLQHVRTERIVSWDAVRGLKTRAIRAAFTHFREHVLPANGSRAQAFTTFCAQHAPWLDNYALWSAIHDSHGGDSWTTWPEELRARDPGALGEAAEANELAILERKYIQWLLDDQWRDARARAAQHGVSLMGDLPFMVAGDSADVWARQDEFRLDATVGVPPDAFSADGQDWGLPVYRWDVMERTDYEWMRERGERAAELYGACRVDHVVGLYRTYFIPLDGTAKGFTPAEEPAQTKLGETLLGILGSGSEVIAEDLGTVPDFVRTSLGKLTIPGYKVLRWEQDAGVFRDPAAWPTCSVATSGTHDTESLADWWEALPATERTAICALPGLAALTDPPEKFDDRVRDALLDVLYHSASDLAIIPLTDALGARDRVNTPGTVSGENWVYRLPMELASLAADDATIARLAALSRRSSRGSG